METETAALDVTDANELLKALTDADPNSLGTVHILRKLIFRGFGPPSTSPLKKPIFSAESMQKMEYSAGPPSPL